MLQRVTKVICLALHKMRFDFHKKLYITNQNTDNIDLLKGAFPPPIYVNFYYQNFNIFSMIQQKQKLLILNTTSYGFYRKNVYKRKRL